MFTSEITDIVVLMALQVFDRRQTLLTIAASLGVVFVYLTVFLLFLIVVGVVTSCWRFSCLYVVAVYDISAAS